MSEVTLALFGSPFGLLLLVVLVACCVAAWWEHHTKTRYQCRQAHHFTPLQPGGRVWACTRCPALRDRHGRVL